MAKNNPWKEIEKMVDSGTFAITLDNDWFGVYPYPPEVYDYDRDDDEEYQNAWHEREEKRIAKGVSMYQTPEELLTFLAEKLGGVVERV